MNYGHVAIRVLSNHILVITTSFILHLLLWCRKLEFENVIHSMFILAFVGSTWSFGVFIPATTANDPRLRKLFYPRFYLLHLFSYLNSWERVSIFPFECSVQNKGATGTIFITSLVWRGPWLGIEPGTSRLLIIWYLSNFEVLQYIYLIYWIPL